MTSVNGMVDAVTRNWFFVKLWTTIILQIPTTLLQIPTILLQIPTILLQKYYGSTTGLQTCSTYTSLHVTTVTTVTTGFVGKSQSLLMKRRSSQGLKRLSGFPQDSPLGTEY
jgi:hypothetical protein